MYKTTVIAISLHPKGVNPIFGEGVIHMNIDDDAAGGFLVLNQDSATDIKVTAEELQILADEGKKMLDAYDLVTKD